MQTAHVTLTLHMHAVIPHGVSFVATGNNSYYDGPPEGTKAALLREQNEFDLNTRVAPQASKGIVSHKSDGQFSFYFVFVFAHALHFKLAVVPRQHGA